MRDSAWSFQNATFEGRYPHSGKRSSRARPQFRATAINSTVASYWFRTARLLFLPESENRKRDSCSSFISLFSVGMWKSKKKRRSLSLSFSPSLCYLKMKRDLCSYPFLPYSPLFTQRVRICGNSSHRREKKQKRDRESVCVWKSMKKRKSWRAEEKKGKGRKQEKAA